MAKQLKKQKKDIKKNQAAAGEKNKIGIGKIDSNAPAIKKPLINIFTWSKSGCSLFLSGGGRKYQMILSVFMES